MSSRLCRIVLLAVLSAALLCNSFTLGGPAHSFALVASRASKIPRSIRAPFRNTEMMTARGFGKRSPVSKYKDSEAAWNGAKATGEAKFYNDIMTETDNGQVDEVYNDAPTESFPIDWLANEMTQNPALAETILHQFVDANHNGIITFNELLAKSHATSRNTENTPSGSASTSDSANNY